MDSVKKGNKSAKLSINLVSNITAFVIHAGIQFFIVPFLNQNVGNEAFGFISVANEFVLYANIFTVLLNGVVGRFVAYEIHRGKVKRANQYFNSALVADIIIVAFFSIVGIVFVSKVEHFLVISAELIIDVKIIFGLTFLNFLIVTLFSVMNVATFVRNRIDVAAIRNIIGYFIEMVVVAGLFLFNPVVKPYYLILGTLISTIYLAVINIIITIRLLPEINFNVKFFEFGMMKDMLKMGVWSSVSQMSNVLLSSTTTILGNLFLGGNVVGLIALAKTLPNCLNTLFYTLYNVFTPSMIKSYAQNDIDGMVEQGKKSMSIMSCIVLPAIVGIYIFAPEFFCLWLPEKDFVEIGIISEYCRIILLGMIMELPSMPLMYFAVATKKIREETIFSLISSGVFLGIAYIGLKYFSLGGEVIVLSQAINMMIKYFIWVPMYAANTVKINRFAFYGCYIRCIFTAFIIGCVYEGIKVLVDIDTWGMLFVVALSVGLVGYVISFLLIISKSQKEQIKKIIQNRGK